MKNLLITLLFLPTIIFGQEVDSISSQIQDTKKTSVGFSLSLGTLGFIMQVDDYNDYENIESIESEFGLGFGVGMTVNYVINTSFELQLLPGLYFGDRSLTFNYINYNGEIINTKTQYSTTYVQLPLLLKYKLKQKGKTIPYIIGGGNYVFNLDYVNNDGNQNDPRLIYLDKSDFFIELGIGLQFQTKKRPISTELKLSYGILNIVKYNNDEYSEIFSSLNSIMVNLIFKL